VGREMNKYTTFKFPFTFESGRVAVAGGKADTLPSFPEVQEAIGAGVRQVIQTAPGERVMNSNFGVGATEYLFSPVSPVTSGLLAYQVQDQLELWEPRVENVRVLSQINSFNSLDFTLYLQLTEFDEIAALSFSVGF
jgi:phage baseplate assembly protein W